MNMLKRLFRKLRFKPDAQREKTDEEIVAEDLTEERMDEDFNEMMRTMQNIEDKKRGERNERLDNRGDDILHTNNMCNNRTWNKKIQNEKEEMR